MYFGMPRHKKFRCGPRLLQGRWKFLFRTMAKGLSHNRSRLIWGDMD